ncbi:hypothetical protein [Flavobacterium sp.]|jgi:hypothetical protein|uniref:hypothetical protein n=1 Tax=Flavobacterium sp. TaxID=239 RepID=UPI0037BEBAD7
MFRVILFALLFSLNFVSAQIDSGVKVPSFGASGTNAIPPKDKSLDSGINFKPKYKIGEEKDPEPLIQSKSPDMTQDDGLMKAKHDYNPKWLENDRESKDEYKKSQYFGSFNTKSKKMVIMCRDHEYVDGDRVRILQNEQIIYTDVYLEGSFKVLSIDLKPGLNKIEFIALNQGSSGPNTAEFAVIDETGVQIVKNIWNLNTGIKASLIVVSE